MWKANKGKILVTSLVVLLPVLVGLILWSRLPDPMPVHWGVDDQPNGWAGKGLAVFGLPAMLLGIHLLCIWATCADPKHKNISPTMFSLVVWICPVTSVLVHGVTYAAALGRPVSVGFWACLLVGVLFVFIGNYLPKCRPNYTVGFRTPWALHDPENWQRTHRLGGWCMTAAGVVILALSFFPHALWALVPAVAGAAVVPFLYSYLLYRKKAKEDDA